MIIGVLSTWAFVWMLVSLVLLCLKYNCLGKMRNCIRKPQAQQQQQQPQGQQDQDQIYEAVELRPVNAENEMVI